ncbi:MAG: hypothetical protein H6809_07145 [Phycisphaeraceae bacterium]|nr:hypothetical protein [Phycisphaeraceae bacterium]
MNLSQFFEHWKIVENPFRGEEARNDAVFARMSALTTGDPAAAALHSDFEKVLGDPARPSTAIVFGEKGSGKTAMRLQIEARIARHNRESPDQRMFVVLYDDLNGFLDRLQSRAARHADAARPARTKPRPARSRNGAEQREPDGAEVFKRIRLVDHIDAIVSTGVTRLVTALMSRGRSDEPAPDVHGLELAARRDLLLLQALYDAGEHADERTRRLRRLLHLPPPPAVMWTVLVVLGAIPPVAFVVWSIFSPQGAQDLWRLVVLLVLLGLWFGVLIRRLVVDRFRVRSLARRLQRQLRVLDRPERSLARALDALSSRDRDAEVLPVTESEDIRYAMLARLRRVLAGLGYAGIVVIVDRVDEPRLVAGDAERMRQLIWPMMSNKFLQQDAIGFKLLLPIELRYAVFKESSGFFQEARLDKQNMIERLSWTGATLYDLCAARLNACRAEGEPPISLAAMFDEDVTRQDLIDALEQMHQPRDAFKFLYRCFSEHCAGVPAESGQYRVPRLLMETVRRQEAERVQQLHRGIRPA